MTPCWLQRETLFPTLPHPPPEMRLQVDVSGSSLSAVSAILWSHTHILLGTSPPVPLTVKIPTPDKESGMKTFLWPLRNKKGERRKSEKMEQGRGKYPRPRIAMIIISKCVFEDSPHLQFKSKVKCPSHSFFVHYSNVCFAARWADGHWSNVPLKCESAVDNIFKITRGFLSIGKQLLLVTWVYRLGDLKVISNLHPCLSRHIQ